MTINCNNCVKFDSIAPNPCSEDYATFPESCGGFRTNKKTANRMEWSAIKYLPIE